MLAHCADIHLEEFSHPLLGKPEVSSSNRTSTRISPLGPV
jgi:hypothetical protein